MSEQQPEAPALPFAPPAEWGGAATVYGGRCRCIVCARCGHHVANSAQGHHWNWCTVTRSMRAPHFCCPDPAFGCELEASAPVPLTASQGDRLRQMAGEDAITTAGRAAAIVEALEALPAVAEDIRIQLARAMYDSIDRCARCKVCEHQIGAALAVLGPPLERAEAKLAEIEAHCRKHAEWVSLHCPDLGRPAEALVKAADILAITGTEGADHA